ncbi:DUF6889 family protein [Methylobacterium sp. J-068]|uniref:DUF6889 family protein n=1 Tax=Methylobacterium sp. J-068 TaxID=2836649 RepID=UPI001FB96394|nr:hypothetical protein [Methylobacterium sp. J-068]MCJ2036397.1 hypothetical protein [Methylobacterium sp. J-068]
MMRALDITFGGARYRGAYLNAFDQFAALQAVTPILERLASSGSHEKAPASDRLGLLVRAMDELSEDQATRLCDLCLTGISREDAGAWRSVWDAEAGDVLFEDLGTAQLLALLGRVILENLRPYLMRERAEIQAQGDEPLRFTVAELPSGRSWLMRPVERGMCRYESLKDGTLDLADLALMNETLAVAIENESRARLAAKQAEEGRTR